QPMTTTSVSLTSPFTNPSVVGLGLPFTATVTSASGTPPGTVTFYDFFQNSQYISAAVRLNAGTAIWNVGLPAGVNNIVAVYSGDTNFGPSSSTPWTQYVVNNGTSVSTTNLSASPNVFFRQRALFSVQVTTSGGTATGNVVLVGEGNQQFGPMLTLDGN